MLVFLQKLLSLMVSRKADQAEAENILVKKMEMPRVGFNFLCKFIGSSTNEDFSTLDNWVEGSDDRE